MVNLAATGKTNNRQPHLSVIVPLYNEEESVGALHTALTQALAELRIDYELLFVDDGSSDATFARAAALVRIDPYLRVVKFRRNAGQTAAMAAGIDEARGRILVTMDGDLQNDPADIGRLLEKMAEGYDMVVGWRHERQDKWLSRKLPSRIANRIIARTTGVPIRDNGCSLKAYRASLIKNIPLYSEMHRFIPAMSSLAGARIAEIKVRHHARQFGQSKYGLSRIYKVILDLAVIKTITAFSARPLLCFSLIALPMFLLSFLAFAFAAYSGLEQSGPFPLPAAGTGVIFFTAALILVGAGIVGESIIKTADARGRDFFRLTQHEIKPEPQ